MEYWRNGLIKYEKYVFDFHNPLLNYSTAINTQIKITSNNHPSSLDRHQFRFAQIWAKYFRLLYKTLIHNHQSVSTTDPQTAKTGKNHVYSGNRGAGSGIRTPLPLATSPAISPFFSGK